MNLAVWLEDRNGHFAVSWSRYLDKWQNKWVPKLKSARMFETKYF